MCLLLYFHFAGLLLLCQHHYCGELWMPSLASSSELETKDLTTVFPTTSKSRRSSSTQRDGATVLTKTSIISTTTTHSTRLHRITDTPSDETLIDTTTSIDALCLAKTTDGDDTSENYTIKSIDGDIIVTIILDRSENAIEIINFIVNHINGIDLLVHNVSIGEFSCEFLLLALLTVSLFR